eukprot:CAMPEP_0183755984 /NCGR_PEP_ID=MMETSP0739-20130205/4680_1 /TAXON_ID=385413 /ORGANISM="Thalassiosira miniscula, Strain CCMP1093" /LENGTH=102 /DNA_ID=CAMNT_0025993035 /DNA_START=169 /DNA_END=477 /DNA_ORIENTATION=+
MSMSPESFDRRMSVSGSMIPRSTTQATSFHMETEYKRRILELEQRLEGASAETSLSTKSEKFDRLETDSSMTDENQILDEHKQWHGLVGPGYSAFLRFLYDE